MSGLEELPSGGAGARRQRGERWSDDYFSVFRDPSGAADRWRHSLPANEQERILRWLEDSVAYRQCRAAGLWDGGA